MMRTCSSRLEASTFISALTLDNFPWLGHAGPRLRRPTKGPEYDLVLEYASNSLPRPCRGQALTVFLEPQLESGCPDIVAVYWHVATARRWITSRSLLTKADVRLMHYLVTTGPAPEQQLKAYFPTALNQSLARLEAANVIKLRHGLWCSRALSEIFAVRRLIAVEAKISEGERGFWQALHNTWFASESYLLMARAPRQFGLIEEASRFGIGITSRTERLGTGDTIARREQIPKSYASWLFNEWAWRSAQDQPGEVDA